MKVAPFSHSQTPAVSVFEKQKPQNGKASLPKAQKPGLGQLLKKELGATTVFPNSALSKEPDLESLTHKVLWDLWA